MIGKGVFRENFQPQSCSGKKARKTGQAKGNLENIVIIDTDSDQVDDVVIIDFHEFVHQKSHGASGSVPSRDRTYIRQSVISVDDDDESDDEVFVAEGVGELDSDASSSKRCSPASSFMQNSVHIDVDDSQVFKKGFVSSTQRSRETCSAKATGRSHYGLDGSETTGRNRYGLDGSETESSDSDCSDCEVLEACEQWEKASVKRKRHVFNDQSCYDEHPSSSGFHSNFYVDVEMEKRDEDNEGSPVYSGPSNEKYVKENQSTLSSKADSQVDGIHFNLGTENPFKDSDQKVDQKSFKYFGFESVEEMCSFPRSSYIDHEERTRSEDSLYGDVPGASRFEKDLGGKESNFTSLSQACEIQVDNKGSAVRSKDDNLCEAKSKCASFEETPVNCNELVLHAQDGGRTASNERDIINKREKLKETDEYKRANEEEWASRQRQLQIQAEEAQRLRKRKKAETKRLLDMQRRQKERVEEVRETQKKDEEFMNMKEKLRVEIRKGLNKLEMQCIDMASLLRGLGIHVGGGFVPLPSEVQIAYKRALFKFHPDRASKTDVREQVEAEEKFKLISRMKEKFLLTTCH